MSQTEYYAPGRVNLIGEYTDFNGGLVFPCAIDRGTRVVVSRDSSICGVGFSSADFDYQDTLAICVDTGPVRSKEWINYPLGIMIEFAKLGFKVDGYRFHYSGNLPLSAGLSSSASILVLTAFAVNSICSAGLSRTELALLSQRCENEFINVQCGIMDQFVIANARADCAIALDCNSHEYQHVPLNLGEYKIVIGNTNQPRELKSSAYNDRVAECRSAVEALAPATGAKQLADVTPAQLQLHIDLIHDPVVAKRAKHVVEECDRVKRATVALQNNELGNFGELMFQSHGSLRDYFEVSSYTLDCMVELAAAQPGVLGSRMTGAGFGGCTVSLVHGDQVDSFIENVGVAYKEATELEAEFYITTAADGVRELVT